MVALTKPALYSVVNIQALEKAEEINQPRAQKILEQKESGEISRDEAEQMLTKVAAQVMRDYRTLAKKKEIL